MSEQQPLFSDPHFTERFAIGDRVRNRWTNNCGEVTEVVQGRHLLIRWGPSYGGEGHVTRHGSDLGLEVIEGEGVAG